MKKYLILSEYDRLIESRKWVEKIPYIIFPSDWQVQIIPPFAGAVVRFKIKKGNASISIYLDCYSNLGYHGSPYWEIYPYDEVIFRCDIEDTESLLGAINYSIIQQNK